MDKPSDKKTKTAPALAELLQRSAEASSRPFVDSAYYGDAEKWTPYWWDGRLAFRRFFDMLDLEFVIELSSGYGRHAEYSAKLCKHLVLMDVIERNLKICRVRLGGRFPSLEYAKNNGFNFQPVGDGEASAIYCYDSMVHFSADLVASYLADTVRVLRPGGRALYHHSNYPGPQLAHFGQHPHARQCMTQADFWRLARERGLRVVESMVIPWGEAEALDCITLVERLV
jgi:SAM-dependent methyltransferase